MGEDGKASEWDPWAHIAKIRAMLPTDGAHVPIEVIRDALGNRTIEGTIKPLANAIRDVTGVVFIRASGSSQNQGKIIAVRWARRVGDGTPLEGGDHGAAATDGEQSRGDQASPTPSRNRDA